MIEEVVAGVCLFLAVAFDALRDAWMKSEGWWKRHAVKWVSFYVPLTYITVTVYPWYTWPGIAIAAWIVWRVTLVKIAGVTWESHLIRTWRDL